MSEKHAHGTHETHGAHENSDVAISPITVSLVVLGAVIGVTLIAMALMFNGLWEFIQMPESRSPFAEERTLPPEPRLQVNGNADLESMRSQQMQELSSYGWVDKEKGIVRIPIEDAMKAVVRDGTMIQAPTEPAKTGAAKAR